MTRNISPLCIAVAGNYKGSDYDGIHIEPRLKEEVILISINTTGKGSCKVASIAFPVHDQTVTRFNQLVKQTLGNTLSVLL